MFKDISVFFLLSLLRNNAAMEICETGAECVPLVNCSWVYSSLQNGSDIFTSLLRRLHCGFDRHNKPMICCLSDYGVKSGLDLLPSTQVCGTQTNDITTGGQQADLDEHPWMVLIKYDIHKGSRYSCGGVLISSRYVLTASHCVKGSDLPRNWKLSQVRLGEWNLANKTDCIDDYCSPDPLDIDVEEIIAHEDYNPAVGQQNDIALLRLSRDVAFNDFIKPICLSVGSVFKENTFEEYDMELAGWEERQRGLSANIKFKVKVTVKNTQYCKKIYEQAERVITEKQLCSGGIYGENSCKGFSGGPLMGRVDATRRWMAIGVVSYAPSPCGTGGWPGVYTRVTAYTDWIISKMRP